MQRSRPVIALGCRVGAMLDEEPGQIHMTPFERPMQRSRPSFLWAVALAQCVNDLMKSCVVERLANTARINSTHGVVRSTLPVTLDRALHSQTTIKYDVNEIGIGEDIGDGSKGRELAQRVCYVLGANFFISPNTGPKHRP